MSGGSTDRHQDDNVGHHTSPSPRILAGDWLQCQIMPASSLWEAYQVQADDGPVYPLRSVTLQIVWMPRKNPFCWFFHLPSTTEKLTDPPVKWTNVSLSAVALSTLLGPEPRACCGAVATSGVPSVAEAGLLRCR